MKPEIKAAWVAALRSGEYTQGRMRLRSPQNEFCCLGVLCNLHAQAHPEIAAQQTDPNTYFGLVGLPATSVIYWADLPGHDPAVQHHSKWTRLSALNDNGLTFNQIADLIEAQL